MRRMIPSLLALLLAACSTTTQAPEPADPRAPIRAEGALPSPRQAAQNFAQVVAQVEPVAERICRERAPKMNCDFAVRVDRRTSLPPNAFQFVDNRGRPIVAFTISLIADARNVDELAFILGHETAHHIAGHLARQRQSALRGAVLAGVLAGLGGGGARDVQAAQDLGASVGARAFSKEFELEADALGTVIAFEAGFDPEVGARYFMRIADPGNQFLGTHPPNAQRIATVRQTLRKLR